MKGLCGILFLAFGMGFSACNVYNKVHTDYDHGVDFKVYKTFAWLPDSGAAAKDPGFKNTEYDNDIIRNNTKNYINHSLTDRGYRVNKDSPDVVLQLILLNVEKEKVITGLMPAYPDYYFNDRYYYPYYYPRYDYFTYYGWGFGPVFYFGRAKEKYIKGTITFNMYDRKLKKRIWSGTAEGDIYDPEYIRYSVHPAVKKIMKEFPVKPLPRDYSFSGPL